MGRTNSPLEGRVVFVIGVARSGTTWLASLLARHPELIGAGETHLFDRGVDALFDNFENTGPGQGFLASWVDREELVDLVRDFCDGTFVRMRERRKPEARFIVEKTPFSRPRFELELERKLECYPDAWYLHLIRDPRAVVRSWHERWGAAWTAERIGSLWATAIPHIRSRLGDSPRFHELRYDDLLATPVETMGEIFQWLGARRDAEIDGIIKQTAGYGLGSKPARDAETWERELPAADIRAVESSAGEQMLEVGFALRRPAVSPWRALGERTHLSGRIRRRVRGFEGDVPAQRRGRRPPSRQPAGESRIAELCDAFADALSKADESALRSLVSPELRLELRTGAGDLTAKGEDAIRALHGAAQVLFGESFVVQQWVPSAAEPVSSLWFTGRRAHGRRLDLAIAFTRKDGRIVQAFLLCLSPIGLHPSAWDLAAELGTSTPA